MPLDTPEFAEAIDLLTESGRGFLLLVADPDDPEGLDYAQANLDPDDDLNHLLAYLRADTSPREP